MKRLPSPQPGRRCLLVLTTEDAGLSTLSVSNRIVLEPQVFEALLDFVKALKASEGS